ncbi:hypothetical protein Rsub_07175 [Raphidocelis subcapitata]|uniref:Fungal lipase-type domain-containing protein n=1 Tax=Raphidocelis subcapitata TaxID=307507 RepID=A0A2V0P2U5_9CHLO|nr:hypothetical protein Rsub_07175 [Raphidocelis subcapitata]|eukprot:GBF94188.1 hypothetical protein Rsub_07175 [Raphidocelis subcapitata]
MRALGVRRGGATATAASCAAARLLPPPLRRAPPPARAFAGASAAGPQKQQHRQQSPPPPPAARRGLCWVEQHRAAMIASWSGLCYQSDRSDVEAGLAADGLSLVAHGRNDFTSWFVADGAIDAAAFARRALSERSAAAAALPPPPPRRERFVLLRGVQWSAPDLDTPKMARALARVWPRPLAGARREVVAHDGAAEMAAVLFDQLRPYLDHADDAGIPVVFGGHSLGGALSKLLMALYRIHARRHGGFTWPDGQPAPSCYTFGSPPVLAHADGGGGHRVLSLLGLSPAQLRNFVLQGDPVPRAMLSVDPAFQLLSGLPAFRALLELRAALAGGGRGPLSPGRFLFESVGEVHLIKWSPEEGSRLVHLEPHEIEEGLSLLGLGQQGQAQQQQVQQPPPAGAAGLAAPADAPAAAAAAGWGGGLAGPAATVRAVMDHHHGSYAQELEAAARRELSRLAAAGAAAAAEAPAVGGAGRVLGR